MRKCKEDGKGETKYTEEKNTTATIREPRVRKCREDGKGETKYTEEKNYFTEENTISI